jgi:hypothetical protein
VKKALPKGGAFLLSGSHPLIGLDAKLPSATDAEIIIHAVRHGARDPSDDPGSG